MLVLLCKSSCKHHSKGKWDSLALQDGLGRSVMDSQGGLGGKELKTHPVQGPQHLPPSRAAPRPWDTPGLGNPRVFEVIIAFSSFIVGFNTQHRTRDLSSSPFCSGCALVISLIISFVPRGWESIPEGRTMPALIPPGCREGTVTGQG